MRTLHYMKNRPSLALLLATPPIDMKHDNSSSILKSRIIFLYITTHIDELCISDEKNFKDVTVDKYQICTAHYSYEQLLLNIL